MLYNSSYNSSANRSTELYSTRRDLTSPTRQSPSRFERISSPRRELSSPRRELSSPRREVYSPPRHETEVYSSTFKESRKTVRSSPVIDVVDSAYSSNKENEYSSRSQLKKSFSPPPRIDDLYSSRLMSPSPVRNVSTLNL